MTVWTNADGLEVRFGLDQAQRGMVGLINTNNHEQELRVLIDADEINALTKTVVGGSHNVMLPAGVIIQSAKLTVTEAFDSAGDALTLTIGMEKKDGTEIDNDGIDAAIAQAAIDAIGDDIACDGALIGTKLAADGFFSVTVAGAAATAGKAELIVKFIRPIL